jgi:hypothetical protein
LTAFSPRTSQGFDLSEILPAWRGNRAAFVRAPLLAGIAIKRIELIAAQWVVFSVITTHDYDSMYEEIGELIGVSSPVAGTEACHDLVATRTQNLLAANPQWARIGESVLPRSVLPATGTVLDGDPLPVHVFGEKVGNAELYDAVYVRCYLCASTGDVDPLTNVLTRLASNGHGGLNDEFVSYLMKIGEGIAPEQ